MRNLLERFIISFWFCAKRHNIGNFVKLNKTAAFERQCLKHILFDESFSADKQKKSNKTSYNFLYIVIKIH